MILTMKESLLLMETSKKMIRSSIFKYLVDLENKNASVGLRKRKDVVIGGQIHHVHYNYADTDVNAI